MKTRIIFHNGLKLSVRETTGEIINQSLYGDEIVVTRFNLVHLERLRVKYDDMAKLIALIAVTCASLNNILLVAFIPLPDSE